VSLADRVEATITSFREQQAELFSTTAHVGRRLGEGVFDENTGEIEPAEPDTIYDGPCLIRPGERLGSDVTTGERELRFRDVKAKFPVDTPILKDDIVTVTASPHDARLLGAVFRVTDVPLDEWQISRVANLEDITGDVEDQAS
jgi:hypothetical protein